MRIACILTLGLMVELAGQAQDDRGFERGPGRGRFRMPSVGFNTLDTNGDGILDASEIAAAPQSLAKLDKNSDGQITSDEVRMALPRRGGPDGPRHEGEPEGEGRTNIAEDTVKTLMAFDANGDGKLSRSELPERYQGIFDRADVNKDGFLTPEEIRKAVAAQAGPPEPAERGRRGDFDGEHRDGPRRPMNFIRIDPILAAVDSDGDGTISADEIRNSANAIRKLDKDGDGTITREEVMQSAGAR